MIKFKNVGFSLDEALKGRPNQRTRMLVQIKKKLELILQTKLVIVPQQMSLGLKRELGL